MKNPLVPFVILIAAAATVVIGCLPSCNTLLPGHGEPLRTSTPEERADAEEWVAVAESALASAQLARIVTQAQVDTGVKLIAEVRSMIAESAKVPTRWPTVLQRAINLAALVVPVKGKKPTASDVSRG